MQGIITRGVGGFYYVLDAEGQTHQLRAQAKLRRAHIKPMVGDRVEFEPGNDEEDGKDGQAAGNQQPGKGPCFHQNMLLSRGEAHGWQRSGYPEGAGTE